MSKAVTAYFCHLLFNFTNIFYPSYECIKKLQAIPCGLQALSRGLAASFGMVGSMYRCFVVSVALVDFTTSMRLYI